MPNSKPIVGLIILSSLLSACGSKDTCDRPQPYVHSRAGAELVVPRGLTEPDEARRQVIPEISSDRKARSNPCSSGPPDLVLKKQESTTVEATPSAASAPPAEMTPLNIAAGFNSDNVEETVDAWMTSWKSGNAPAYLSFYAKDFIGPDGDMDRDTWLRRRQALLEMTGPADITMRDISVEDLPGQRKMVRFVQEFTAKDVTQSVVKLLEMVREGEGWRIRQEKVVKVL